MSEFMRLDAKAPAILAEDELAEASARPLSRKQRDALIESSLPAAANKKSRAFSKR